MLFIMAVNTLWRTRKEKVPHLSRDKLRATAIQVCHILDGDNTNIGFLDIDVTWTKGYEELISTSQKENFYDILFRVSTDNFAEYISFPPLPYRDMGWCLTEMEYMNQIWHSHNVNPVHVFPCMTCQGNIHIPPLIQRYVRSGHISEINMWTYLDDVVIFRECSICHKNLY